MKILITFYSRTGITRKTAKDMGQLISTTGYEIDIEEIIDKKDRSGKIGYMVAGKDALAKKETEIGDVHHDPGNYDMVILGTPVWAGTITPAVRTYLHKYRECIKEAAFFCTHGGGGSSKTFDVMEDILDLPPLAVESFRDKSVKKEGHKGRLNPFLQEILSSKNL